MRVLEWPDHVMFLAIVSATASLLLSGFWLYGRTARILGAGVLTLTGNRSGLFMGKGSVYGADLSIEQFA
jgi:hypothetical protein